VVTRVSPRETVVVEPGPSSAATYLSWLAYPATTEKQERAEFVRAATAGLAKAFVRSGYPRQKVPPELRGLKKKKIDGTANKGLWRVATRRRYAAWMAIGVLDGLAGIRGVNTAAAELADRFAENGRILEQSNIIKRVWSETKPVLHVALALPSRWSLEWSRQHRALLLGLPMPQSYPWNPRAPLATLVGDISWVLESLLLAEIFRPFLASEFPEIDEADTIQLVASPAWKDSPTLTAEQVSALRNPF
jgi:hypothetical protein